MTYNAEHKENTKRQKTSYPKEEVENVDLKNFN